MDYNDANFTRFYLYNVETTEIVELVDENVDSRIYDMFHSAFSDDSSKIYYTIDSGGFSGVSTQIYVIDFKRYLRIAAVETEQPEAFAVMNNYPNPFNPTTTIEFTLPETGFTELIIYNIMGQKIRELVSADMPAGVHSAVWDGRDENGTPASSGLFVSRLTSGVNVVSNRMMLVK